MEKIFEIRGFNPILEEGDIVFYLTGHSPNIKMRVGKYVGSKGDSVDGTFEDWYIEDLLDGKKRYPYCQQCVKVDDIRLSAIMTTWYNCDDHGNRVSEDDFIENKRAALQAEQAAKADEAEKTQNEL